MLDPLEIPTLGQFNEAELTVLLYEFKSDLDKYLASLGPLEPMRKRGSLLGEADSAAPVTNS